MLGTRAESAIAAGASPGDITVLAAGEKPESERTKSWPQLWCATVGRCLWHGGTFAESQLVAVHDATHCTVPNASSKTAKMTNFTRVI